jgi:hypothetical protein
VLIGYAISGERTLADFFERVAPFATAFMALDAAGQSSASLQPESLSGRCRSSLPTSLSQALRAVQLCAISGPQKPSVASGIDKVAAIWSLMSMPHARRRGNARCRVLLNCLLHNADEGAVCAPGYTGRKRGEVVRTRTTARRDAYTPMDRHLRRSRQWQ